MTSAPASGGIARNAAPFLHGPEVQAMSEVLASGQWGHGPVTEQFERALADYLGVQDVVALSSGTAALLVALLANGIGPGDEVVLPSLTFAASVQTILFTGAVPRFAEVDPDTLCVTAQTVLDALTPATRAVMPVLYGGRAVDLTVIHNQLRQRGVVVVQDAAHAFGSRTATGRVGADTDVATCFSFDPIKNLTTGQGGAIVPRTREEAAHARRLRLFGVEQSAAERAGATSYTVAGPGLRFDLSPINAAIGLVQLEHFPAIAARRQHLWRTYQRELSVLEGVALVDVGVDRSVPFNCVVRLPDSRSRDAVFRALHRQGIGVGVHYPPNHTQPAFARWHRALPATEQVAGQIISLPFHPGLDDSGIGQAVAALRQAVKAISPPRHLENPGD
ncbi:DegT/DnrJ/EryC1/StrS family aminotransferase [Kitasatospora sp. NPDC058965]|uniref:DegT/DnrJ/EryC1/StrS family aminotransferase n=1 Tax=Kitasatospora sp. NPDC058965 TaxID=3346682 RepID=UPI0036BFCDAB